LIDISVSVTYSIGYRIVQRLMPVVYSQHLRQAFSSL